MYSCRLKSFTIHSKSFSKSLKNKIYRVRYASMHSQSNSSEIRSDIDVDSSQKDKVNYATIVERNSEESVDLNNINLSSISKPQN